MTALERIVLAGVLLSAAGCSSPVACETASDCGESDATRGYVCVADACQPCEIDSDCTAGYGAGATCTGGRCEAAACTSGEEGCECAAGDTCDAGLVCTAGVCRGETATGCEGCPCGAGDTCDAGLACMAGVCRDETATGCEGCPCGAGGACDAGLACEGGTCVSPTCEAGTEGCPCATGGTCDLGLTCDATSSTCRACVPGEAMCACGAGGSCGAGLSCGESPMCPAGTSECCLPSECGTGTEGTLGCMCRTTDPPCGPGAVCRGGLCVCGDNYTGASCEIACTDHQLMVSTDPVFNPAADQGFWLCGHFAASDEIEIRGGTYSLRGEIPITPTDRAVLSGGTYTVTSR